MVKAILRVLFCFERPVLELPRPNSLQGGLVASQKMTTRKQLKKMMMTRSC